MVNSFEKLIKLIPPPANPLEVGNMEEWGKIEEELKLKLPEDYKRIVCTYGTGYWMEFLWVLNPFSKGEYFNLQEQIRSQLDAEREIKKEYPEEIPFPIYPEEGGLLPWAMTDNGDRLYWLTSGLPEQWATIIYESRGPEYDKRKSSCSEILLRWVTGKIKIKVFPEDFNYDTENVFVPFDVNQ